MKLKYTFETMELDDHVIAVPVGDNAQGFRGVVKLNESATDIFELLKQGLTRDEIVNAMKKRYPDDSEIENNVDEFISGLKGEGILE